MISIKNIFLFVIICSFAVLAQEQTPQQAGDLAQASEAVNKKLEASLNELAALREQAASENIPLSKKLSELESQLDEVGREYQSISRLLDSRTLDMNNLRSEIKARHEEAAYLSSLLGEYGRNFESRLHIAEIQRYSVHLEAAGLAVENSNLSEQEVYSAQTALLNTSLERLKDALGGSVFEGKAVDESGVVRNGKFALIGPVAIFKSNDGKIVGTVEQKLGSLEPSVSAFANSDDSLAADEIISNGSGRFPYDPTLGNAHVIEATKETLVEHIKKGGPVMVPILAMAAAAFAVVIYKWFAISIVRKPRKKQIGDFLNAIAEQDHKEINRQVKAIKGPFGKMLQSAVEHIKEPSELIEEVMYETILSTKLKLQSLLPFVAISAASAPLLGLLGTVTGIINTFSLITVYGSGDPKMLSSGISEALITTEYGLIVAIPCVLLHSFLSRKAKSVVDEMEKAAMALVNQISKTSYKSSTVEKGV